MTSREIDQLAKPTFRSRYAHTPWNRVNDRWTQSHLLVKRMAGLGWASDYWETVLVVRPPSVEYDILSECFLD